MHQIDLVGYAISEECRPKTSKQSGRPGSALVRTRTFAVLQWGRSHRRPILLSPLPNRLSRGETPMGHAAEVAAVATARKARARDREAARAIHENFRRFIFSHIVR